jgi:5-formyltetrahydrofolate cyclo-ligase
MQAHLCDRSDLVIHKWGLPEPPLDALRIDPADIDVVLVPGVAFDTSGNRIGYGKGFYDRFLASLAPGTITIGLTYNETLYSEFLRDDHDIAVHFVVTPAEVLGHKGGLG